MNEPVYHLYVPQREEPPNMFSQVWDYWTMLEQVPACEQSNTSIDVVLRFIDAFSLAIATLLIGLYTGSLTEGTEVTIFFVAFLVLSLVFSVVLYRIVRKDKEAMLRLPTRYVTEPRDISMCRYAEWWLGRYWYILRHCCRPIHTRSKWARLLLATWSFVLAEFVFLSATAILGFKDEKVKTWTKVLVYAILLVVLFVFLLALLFENVFVAQKKRFIATPVSHEEFAKLKANDFRPLKASPALSEVVVKRELLPQPPPPSSSPAPPSVALVTRSPSPPPRATFSSPPPSPSPSPFPPPVPPKSAPVPPSPSPSLSSPYTDTFNLRIRNNVERKTATF